MAAEKADGVVLGKPKDSLQASMLVKDRERIQGLFLFGVLQKFNCNFLKRKMLPVRDFREACRDFYPKSYGDQWFSSFKP